MSLDLTDWQNKKYTTRDGRPVRILCVDAKLPNGESIAGLLKHEDGTEGVRIWHDGGCYFKSDKDASFDLINAKTKKEGWVNVYKPEDGDCLLHKTKELADENAYDKRIACVKIEWEE